MKKIIITLLMSLMATSSMAASSKVLKAVLNSDVINNVQNIEKIEVVADYRCPNCHDILITGTNILGEAYVKVRTVQSGESLIVKYLEGSK